MSQLKYAMQGYDEKIMAKARLNNSEVSRKVSIEICNMIRFKTTKKAKMLLEEIIDMKRAVPYKRFNRAVAHRTGIGPGRYPVKTVEEILKLVKLAEANAQNKGLSQDLIIKHLAANKGTMQWHLGRQSRRQIKSAHIEIVVCEKDAKMSESKASEHAQKSKIFDKSEPKPKSDEVKQKKADAPKHEEIKEEKKHEAKEKDTPKKAAAPKAKSESKPKAKKLRSEKND